MVLSLSALLVVSVAGVSVLLGVKQYELQSGRVVFARVRPAAGAMLGAALHFCEQHLPALALRALKHAWALVRQVTHRAVAWFLLHTETLLERTLRTLRYNTRPEGGEASAF